MQDPSGRGIGQTNRLMQDAGYFGTIALADLYVGGMNYIAHNPVMWLGTLPQVKSVMLYEAEDTLDTWLKAQDMPGGLVEGEPVAELAMGAGLYEGVGEDFRSFLTDCLSKLKRSNEFKISPTTLPMKMTRGCAHRCSFCTCHFKGGKQRTPWRKVGLDGLDEAMSWAAANGFDKVAMLDEAPNLDMDFFSAVLDLTDKHKLRLEFPNGLRADCLTEELVRRLAGKITRLSISPESGSPTVAEKLIGKRMAPEASRHVAQWAKEAGLATAMHFIIGLPGEKRQDILETFKFARDCYESFGALPLMPIRHCLAGNVPVHGCNGVPFVAGAASGGLQPLLPKRSDAQRWGLRGSQRGVGRLATGFLPGFGLASNGAVTFADFPQTTKKAGVSGLFPS